jgi:hypothetical protein
MCFSALDLLEIRTDSYHVPPGEALRSNTLIRSKYLSALKAAAAIEPGIAIRNI